jgi:hypothetical protein
MPDRCRVIAPSTMVTGSTLHKGYRNMLTQNVNKGNVSRNRILYNVTTITKCGG